MISSERRVLGGLALVLAGAALSCGVVGDRDGMGCPTGERCSGSLVGFYRAGAIPCVAGPILLQAELDASRGSTAVALGGTTWARAPESFTGTVRFSSEFETLSVEGLLATARAVRVGPGRFDAYRDDDTLADYLAMPVVPAERVVVSDRITCPDQPRALLRNVGVHLLALAVAEDGGLLVDTGASVRSATGDETITPSVGDTIDLRVAAGTLDETVTLPVVEAADEIVAIVTPLEQLRGEVYPRFLEAVCFQARSGGRALLGVPMSAVRVEGGYSASPPFDEPPSDELAAILAAFPSCVWLSREDPTHPSQGVLEVDMAGLTARYPLVERY